MVQGNSEGSRTRGALWYRNSGREHRNWCKFRHQWYISTCRSKINSSLLLISTSIQSAEFPWNELGDGASVCDVGGGVGAMTLQLAKRYPTLNLKLQDLPERILQAKNEVWPELCPEAIKEKRIQFEPIDFLSESPIQGCNVYYVSNSL